MPPSGAAPAVVKNVADGIADSTVTAICWVADNPPGSVAVTVTVALPVATATSVTTLPDTETLTTPAEEVATACVNRSPSGSRKLADTSTVAVSPATMVNGVREPTAWGGWFGGGGGGGSVPPSPPQASVAITVAKPANQTGGNRNTPGVNFISAENPPDSISRLEQSDSIPSSSILL